MRRLPLLAPPAPRTLEPDVRQVDSDAFPYYVVWEITLACDLACRHCGSRAGRAREGELSTAEALDVIDQLHAMGTQEISLIGGEVYLRDDWAILARAIKDRGMSCGIVSGGRGVDRARAQTIKDAGVDGVSISVDGLEETHDALRGVQGSHRAALAALGHLDAVGLRRSANTQVCTANLREIEPLLEALAPTGIHAWQVQITVAMGRAADHPELLFQPWQMIEVMPMLARAAQRARALGIRLWPGNNVGYFGPYEEVFRGRMQRGHLEPCTAGRLTMGLEANGDVKGCPSLPSKDYVGGNVREHRLRDIWERAGPLRFTRGRTVDDLRGFCRSCYYAEDCLGGCTWTSHVLFGRRGDNPYCHHRALELLRQGRRERLTRVAPPPGEPFDHGVFALDVEPWPDDELARANGIASSGEGFLGSPPARLSRPRPTIREVIP
jgi:radical SAM protein with 4Fe4S-binding SPASM domain